MVKHTQVEKSLKYVKADDLKTGLGRPVFILSSTGYRPPIHPPKNKSNTKTLTHCMFCDINFDLAGQQKRNTNNSKST